MKEEQRKVEAHIHWMAASYLKHILAVVVECTTMSAKMKAAQFVS